VDETGPGQLGKMNTFAGKVSNMKEKEGRGEEPLGVFTGNEKCIQFWWVTKPGKKA